MADDQGRAGVQRDMGCGRQLHRTESHHGGAGGVEGGAVTPAAISLIVSIITWSMGRIQAGPVFSGVGSGPALAKNR